jgi:uncharacterized protein (DUF58 family)
MGAPPSSEPLLDARLLHRLERLRMAAPRIARSAMSGERRSRARGQSTEFADHRAYVPGDDLRRLDWSLYGRLDRLYLRLFEEDRELRVLLFLDASESMNFGTPTKFQAAARLAAAIGHATLCGFDRVGLRVFPGATPSADGSSQASADWRGRRATRRLQESIAQVRPGGRGGFNEALRRGAFESKQAGAAVVLSDFLDPGGYEDGLSALTARGFRVEAIQVVCGEEIEPTAFGDLNLVDSETGARTEVTFSRQRLETYRKAWERHTSAFKSFCRARGIGCHQVAAETPVEDVLLRQFRTERFWV